MRFCVHCQKPISREVLTKGRWKAIFCSATCRLDDRNSLREARREARKERGMCYACGHKLQSARMQNELRRIQELVKGGE